MKRQLEGGAISGTLDTRIPVYGTEKYLLIIAFGLLCVIPTVRHAEMGVDELWSQMKLHDEPIRMAHLLVVIENQEVTMEVDLAHVFWMEGLAVLSSCLMCEVCPPWFCSTPREGCVNRP